MKAERFENSVIFLELNYIVGTSFLWEINDFGLKDNNKNYE